MTQPPYIQRDIAILKTAKRTPLIDYVTWTPSPAARRHKLANTHPGGDYQRTHDVRAKDLARWPEEVLDCCVDMLEFSIDLAPPGPCESQAEAFSHLRNSFAVLRRYLAPWTSGWMEKRIYHFGEVEVRRAGASEADQDHVRTRYVRGHVSTDKDLVTHNEDGSHVIWDFTGIDPPLPRLLPNGQVLTQTTYYGHRPVNGESAVEPHGEAMVQVRLYIKTVDKKKALPWQDHRTRVEITMNRAALRQHLNVFTLGDLRTVDYRKLTKKLLAMKVPVRPARSGRKPGRPGKQLQHITQRRRIDTLKFMTPDEHAIYGNYREADKRCDEYKNVPELTNLLLTPARSFNQAMARNSRNIVHGTADTLIANAPDKSLIRKDFRPSEGGADEGLQDCIGSTPSVATCSPSRKDKKLNQSSCVQAYPPKPQPVPEAAGHPLKGPDLLSFPTGTDEELLRLLWGDACGQQPLPSPISTPELPSTYPSSLRPGAARLLTFQGQWRFRARKINPHENPTLFFRASSGADIVRDAGTLLVPPAHEEGNPVERSVGPKQHLPPKRCLGIGLPEGNRPLNGDRIADRRDERSAHSHNVLFRQVRR